MIWLGGWICCSAERVWSFEVLASQNNYEPQDPARLQVGSLEPLVYAQLKNHNDSPLITFGAHLGFIAIFNSSYELSYYNIDGIQSDDHGEKKNRDGKLRAAEGSFVITGWLLINRDQIKFKEALDAILAIFNQFLLTEAIPPSADYANVIIAVIQSREQDKSKAADIFRRRFRR